MKCKMQDNLDFLQFSKRYWDQHFPGGDYDPIARRKGSGAPTPAAPRAPMSAARKPAASSGAAPRMRTPQGTGGAATAALKEENAFLKESIASLEREREFYFNKLREIEEIVHAAFQAEPELEKDDNNILKQIQAILYATEVRVVFVARLGTKNFLRLTELCRRASKSQKAPRARLASSRRRHSEK